MLAGWLLLGRVPRDRFNTKPIYIEMLVFHVIEYLLSFRIERYKIIVRFGSKVFKIVDSILSTYRIFSRVASCHNRLD